MVGNTALQAEFADFLQVSLPFFKSSSDCPISAENRVFLPAKSMLRLNVVENTLDFD